MLTKDDSNSLNIFNRIFILKTCIISVQCKWTVLLNKQDMSIIRYNTVQEKTQLSNK